MKQNKWVIPIGVMVIVAMAAVVAGKAQSTVFGDSPVLPEPLPGSYADQQKHAYAYQAGAIPGMGYWGTSTGLRYTFTRQSPYCSAYFPMHSGFYDPRTIIYSSQPFPQPYGPYMPEIPANHMGPVNRGRRGDIR